MHRRARPAAPHWALALSLWSLLAVRADAVPTVLVFEDFTKPPAWDAVNSVPEIAVGIAKTQDFGFSPTGFASASPGEVGGRVTRSFTPASYLKPIPTKTLNDVLQASGTLTVPQSSGGSGVLVGWFHHTSRGWRTPNSLAFRIDGDSGKYRVFFEYGTSMWRTGGGQTFEGRYQTTDTPPIAVGEKPHAWAIAYDPAGSGGLGEITFTLDGTVYRSTLGEGDRAQGAEFDRFGILNQQTSGDELTVYIGDLTLDGEPQDLSRDPGWEGIGNRASFVETIVRPYHCFGHRDTGYAGGMPGEIGGVVWRLESTEPERALAYGAPLGRLTLADPLAASGKVAMRLAGVDSAMLLGWYNSRTAIGAPPANFVGVLIEGPSRVGHYWRPIYSSSVRGWETLESGPVLRPDGVPRAWSVRYDPTGEEGVVTATLGEESVSLPVPAQAVQANAVFDRFGCLSWQRGGLFVELYLDDLEYTAQAGGSEPLSR